MVEQALINMNGRIYDYNLGRFMSVDPFIQMPQSSQSINPYSYIKNNPMAGTDPTGYQSVEDADTTYQQTATVTQKAEDELKVDVVETRRVQGNGYRLGSKTTAKIGTATISNGVVTSVQNLKGKTVASSCLAGGMVSLWMLVSSKNCLRHTHGLTLKATSMTII